MALPSKNNRPLFDILGNPKNPYPDRHIGIEVELEGSLFGSSSRLVNWNVKPEGSLRNGGMEYVLRTPMNIAKLEPAYQEFDMLMSKSKPLATIRCSTHIHISVMDFTLTQIYNAMVGWYFLENLLVRTQPANRQGNLFCLRLSDAEEIAISIKDSIEYHDGIYTFHPERNRYAALNLCAITKFGSFEFRFLEAMTTSKAIDRWVKILYRLVNTAKNFKPSELLQMYEAKTALDFIGTLIGHEYVPYVTKGLMPGTITRLLHSNYDHIFEFSALLERKGKFELPRYMWNEDLEGHNSLKFSSPFPPMSPEMVAELLGTATEQQAQMAIIDDLVPHPWQPIPPTPPSPFVSVQEAVPDDFDPDYEDYPDDYEE